MKVILHYVSSLDGKTTHWKYNRVSDWSSAEDHKHFMQIIKSSNLIITGSKTFENYAPQSTEGTLRIIMTRHPEKYKHHAIPGQLEFTNEPPKQLVNRLKKEKYKNLTLVSGSQLTTAFLKDNLIDELWLTLEPKLLGKGNSLVQEEELDVTLKLLESKKLNDQGTLLLKYAVVK